MKKLFVAALAIAALAACNKEEGPTYLESNKKAISITIANGVTDTRAVVPEVTPTANGGVATIQEQAAAEACATTDELVILFANRAGQVVEAYTFDQADLVTTEGNGNKYTYHAVHESVEQVAVVRYAAITTVSEFVNTNLSVYAEAAAVEDRNVSVADLELYAVSGLNASGECSVETDDHVWETYKLYTASLNVQPALARVEIIGVNCTNLGEMTLSNYGVGANIGGYDKLALGTVSFGNATDKMYTYAFNSTAILLGKYAGNGASRDPQIYDLGDKAITWNVAPQAAPSETYPMVFTMTAEAYDYNVLNKAKTLTIEKFNGITNLERGKIYRLDLEFEEENIDVTNDAICVDVTVTIANWVVEEVQPVFGTN